MSVAGPTGTNGPSLLDRFGGDLEVEAYIDDVYNMMARDAVLKDFFGTSAGRAFNLQILKDRTVDYLCSSAPGAFGTEPYHGPLLFDSHASLRITPKQYDVFMKCAKTALKKRKTNAQVTAEVLKNFEWMRDPIVDPDGKHLNELQGNLERAKEEAKKKAEEAGGEEDPSGFGMSVPKATLDKWKAEENRRAELKRKLAAAKAARMQSENAAKAAAVEASAKPKDKTKSKATAKEKARSKDKAKAKAETQVATKAEDMAKSEESDCEWTEEFRFQLPDEPPLSVPLACRPQLFRV